MLLTGVTVTVLLFVCFLVVLAENARFIQLLDLKFYDFAKFLSEYSSDANAYLTSAGAAGGIVSTDKIHKVKGLWDPSYIIVNFWVSPEQFEAAYSSGMKRDCFRCQDKVGRQQLCAKIISAYLCHSLIKQLLHVGCRLCYLLCSHILMTYVVI